MEAGKALESDWVLSVFWSFLAGGLGQSLDPQNKVHVVSILSTT